MCTIPEKRCTFSYETLTGYRNLGKEITLPTKIYLPNDKKFVSSLSDRFL